jgi:purine-binding chemotaxis protein CheW
MQADETTTDGLLVTRFVVGTAAFGLDARLVLEVVKVGDLTRVHNAPAEVLGIRNLRGRIVTVVDMAMHLQLGQVTADAESRLLIMEHQGETYGFLVDTVTDATAMDAEALETPPASLSPALRRRLVGVWRQGGQLTAILNPATLFQWNEE